MPCERAARGRWGRRRRGVLGELCAAAHFFVYATTASRIAIVTSAPPLLATQQSALSRPHCSAQLGCSPHSRRELGRISWLHLFARHPHPLPRRCRARSWSERGRCLEVGLLLFAVIGLVCVDGKGGSTSGARFGWRDVCLGAFV